MVLSNIFLIKLCSLTDPTDENQLVQTYFIWRNAVMFTFYDFCISFFLHFPFLFPCENYGIFWHFYFLPSFCCFLFIPTTEQKTHSIFHLCRRCTEVSIEHTYRTGKPNYHKCLCPHLMECLPILSMYRTVALLSILHITTTIFPLEEITYQRQCKLT